MDACQRCDRCGTQAYTRWWHPTAGRLTLCGHHTKRLERSLRAKRWLLETDDRWLLDQLTGSPS